LFLFAGASYECCRRDSFRISILIVPTSSGPARELYEVRTYRLTTPAARSLLDRYLEKAFLPALNRQGVSNVGVFTELKVNKEAGTAEPLPDSPIWLLMAHSSFESFLAASAGANADPVVQQAGRDYLEVEKDHAVFTRIDSWLLHAFTGMPKMEIPGFSRQNAAGRIFELRSYESYSESKALKKIAMFNEGETGLMRKLGMSPLFFGQALTGRDLPHLTYITSAPDLATHLANWRKFVSDPEWAVMRDDPKWANTVSKNTPHFLVPTAYSQI
jgi:hypothetical protein